MRGIHHLLLCLPTLLAAQAPEPQDRISDTGLRIADSNPQPSNLQPSSSSTPHSALRTPHSSLETLSDPNADASLRNELANELTRDPAQHAALADALLAAWADPAQPVIWQDYALQHIGNLAALHPDDTRLSSALWKAVDIPQHTHASTSLLGLLQQPLQHPRVREASHTLAADPNATPGNRATALQILLQLQDSQALPIARGILSSTPHSAIPNPHSSSSPSIPLRLSALAVLGRLGDSSDLPLLTSYHHNPLSPLRNAARTATARLASAVSPGN